jgi:hypothetical protein
MDAFRKFADDPRVEPGDLGKQQILVVVAAGKDAGFEKMRQYLASRGVGIELVEVRLFRGQNREYYMETEPVDLGGSGPEPSGSTWLINTDETHSPGSWQRFLDKGVAGIWGYDDGARTLQQGAELGDAIFAYRNGHGVIARGVIRYPKVRQIVNREESLFPGCEDGNEWHIGVDWQKVPEGRGAVSNSEIRAATGAGLPVRNTFCRLWNPKVRAALDKVWEGVAKPR